VVDTNAGVTLGAAALTVLAGGWFFLRLAVRRAEKTLVETLQAASTIVSGGLASRDPQAALDRMTRSLAELLEAQVCVIALPTGDRRLYCGSAYGFEDPDLAFIGEDEGMCGASYMAGEAVVAPDIMKETRYVPTVDGVISAATVPLRYEGRILGAFDVESRTRRYSNRDLAVLIPLGDQIAAVIANLKLRREAEARASIEEKSRRETEAISTIVMAGVAAGTGLDSTLESMVKEIATALNWPSMGVILLHDDGVLHTHAAYGYSAAIEILRARMGEGIVGKVAESGIGRRVTDVRLDPDYRAVVSQTLSEVCVPLRAGERILGVLNAESPRRDAFSSDDLRLLQALADQMAVVVEHARLAGLERDAHERLRELDTLKDDFVATVSHELRTPLTSIKGFAQTMLSREEMLSAEDRRSFLRAMTRQCDKLTSMVNRLLLVSQLEAGEVATKNTYVALKDLMRDAIEGSKDGDRVRVELSGRPGLICDLFRAHHIVRNLIENACKYSPAASPVLVRASISDAGLTVDVLDNGPGIPSGSESEIFDRFRRLSESATARATGSGLGLYIARRFARDVGGDVSVSRCSEDGWTGAHFSVWLPEGRLPQTAA
jgi:signal transduction histidine kinase